MAKYKRYDYSQSMLIPVFFEEQLMPGSLEFSIHTLVETRMDMSIFEDNYANDQTGRSAYDPKILMNDPAASCRVSDLAYSNNLSCLREVSG